MLSLWTSRWYLAQCCHLGQRKLYLRTKLEFFLVLFWVRLFFWFCFIKNFHLLSKRLFSVLNEVLKVQFMVLYIAELFLPSIKWWKLEYSGKHSPLSCDTTMCLQCSELSILQHCHIWQQKDPLSQNRTFNIPMIVSSFQRHDRRNRKVPGDEPKTKFKQWQVHWIFLLLQLEWCGFQNYIKVVFSLLK